MCHQLQTVKALPFAFLFSFTNFAWFFGIKKPDYIKAAKSWQKFVIYTILLSASDPFEVHVITLNMYRQVSNIRRTLVGNNIVDISDVVGASPVGAAPTTSSLST